MNPLSESEIAQIARLQRDVGVQRLSCHFSWSEFCDERRRFHQEFVYDVAMFAIAHGFSWSDVIHTAAMARCIFPQLDGLDVPKILFLLNDSLSEFLPNLTPIQRHKLSQFLTDTCTARQRLFQAVVGGAANISITQLHLEVQLPPTPQPLTQGMEVQEWEQQLHQAQLTSTLLQKEQELKMLRDNPRVTVGDIPDDVQLEEEGVLEVVRAAVRATEDQMLASLNREVSLLSDILQLKLQQAALTTGGRHNSVPLRTNTPAKAKTETKTGVKSGNAASGHGPSE